MPKSVVAIVGRPNVGKSTLFNRLIGERQAIIEDEPGTTRDRIYSHADWNGRDFTLIDTGGIVPEAAGETGDAFTAHIRAQATTAIEEADVILFLVDARDGITSADEMVAEVLRRANKPVVLVANKADNVQRRDTSAEFYQFGLGDPYPISAFHGTGTGDMLDQLVALLPPREGDEETEDTNIHVAIVGRPNVGKSALLNALIGQERTIVSAIPGTTRDAIDTLVEWDGQPITLIDTAGIRRRGRVEHGVEQYSVVRSLRAINRADVVLLVIDSDEGLTAQDAHVAGYVQEEYAGLVIVMNKWDLVTKDSNTMQVVTDRVRAELKWVANAPIVFVSALTGQRVNTIPAVALKVAAEREQRVPTAALNKVLRAAFEDHQVTLRGGKRLKFFYATQPAIKPPTFVLYVNAPDELHFSYRRYLENTIRREYGFDGVPLRISFRGRDSGR